MTTEKGEKTGYDDGFKQHIVELYKTGQSVSEIARSYQISKTSVSNWVKYESNSGSFKRRDNLSDTEKEIEKLRRELRQKEMEIDILKKAMAVMLK